ncbi:MAG: 50S ribosomal protein L35 [Candidatus Omnitrophica bacterium]|nr:50S ribosomal protein L35 [Candidatus Omnitrophota bacterium]
MPKLKTNKSAAKRFRVTRNRKVLRTRAGHRHLMTGHTRDKKRHQRKHKLVDRTDRHRILAVLPYSR